MADHRTDQFAVHLDVAGYVLGTLTPEETAAFEAHLAGCAACQAELSDLGSLPALLAEAAPPLPPRLTGPAVPPWLGQPPQAEQWAPQPPVAQPAATNVVPLRPRRSAAVRWGGAAAAAVLLVVAVGVGIVVTRPDGPSGTTVALVAADSGTGRGTAVVSSVGGGREVHLDVAGLPANPPGTYYECWFVGQGDTAEQPNRVSAGTFTVGSDGTATVTLVSAADPARFPKLGVTLEPDDGNPARTGPKFLVSAP